ncbi:hypothetical protein [Fodinicola acaciae]|uniref:hypothetical protein n=1 Tax=Fodinicola acaciae TaxID=2681555 RepID=UPI0013D5AA8A|nr:hypothetical protein [Fodinicola acaciae]
MTDTRPEPADRLLFHLIWEGVLLLAVLVLLVVVLATGGRIGVLFLSVAATGIVAFAFSLSVRAAVPNLAVVGAAAVGAAIAAQVGGVLGIVVSIVVLVVVGALVALAAVLLPVPTWAGTLVFGLALSAVASLVLGNQSVQVGSGGAGTTIAGVLFGLAAIGSIGVGVACAFWPVRRTLGQYRSVGDGKRGLPALGVAAGATVVSTVVAGIGGIIGAYYLGVAVPTSTPQLLWIIAAVLIGGASLRGRRVGVAGTFLGVMLVACVSGLTALAGLSSALTQLLLAVMAVVGLVVSWGADALGGGRTPPRTLAQ